MVTELHKNSQSDPATSDQVDEQQSKWKLQTNLFTDSTIIFLQKSKSSIKAAK